VSGRYADADAEDMLELRHIFIGFRDAQ